MRFFSFGIMVCHGNRSVGIFNAVGKLKLVRLSLRGYNSSQGGGEVNFNSGLGERGVI